MTLQTLETCQHCYSPLAVKALHLVGPSAVPTELGVKYFEPFAIISIPELQLNRK